MMEGDDTTMCVKKPTMDKQDDGKHRHEQLHPLQAEEMIVADGAEENRLGNRKAEKHEENEDPAAPFFLRPAQNTNTPRENEEAAVNMLNLAKAGHHADGEENSAKEEKKRKSKSEENDNAFSDQSTEPGKEQNMETEEYNFPMNIKTDEKDQHKPPIENQSAMEERDENSADSASYSSGNSSNVGKSIFLSLSSWKGILEI